MGLRDPVGNLRAESKTIKMDPFPSYLTAKVSPNRHQRERKKERKGAFRGCPPCTGLSQLPTALSAQPALGLSAHRTWGQEEKARRAQGEVTALTHPPGQQMCLWLWRRWPSVTTEGLSLDATQSAVGSVSTTTRGLDWLFGWQPGDIIECVNSHNYY